MCKIRCPKCWDRVEIEVTEIPLEAKCPKCEAVIKLYAALLPARVKPHISSLATAA